MGFHLLFILICIQNLHNFLAANDIQQRDQLRTYIVHIEPNDSQNFTDLKSWYHSFLPKNSLSSRMIYAYNNVLSGFAARLSIDEVKEMAKKSGFISALPEQVLSLTTTHTPKFLGLNQNMGFWKESNYGEGVVIGVIDTGVQPDHPSFNDEGLPPPPATWKGYCEFNFMPCNNKIIGARNFVSDDVTPLDIDGHGTHTASTAAGNFVKGANVFGNANGTAVGVASFAHLAIYKACKTRFHCWQSEILAAMEAAIDDGVNVLSLSLIVPSTPFYNDSIAIGAFRAMEKGIFVSCSSGNLGPSHATLSNEAPWILTVGASTLDRKLTAVAVLGNNEEIEGESAFQPNDFYPKQLPIVYPGLNSTFSETPDCSPISLKNIDVKGKVVLCKVDIRITGIEQGQAVKKAGGAAMVLMNTKDRGFITFADPYVLPTTNVDYVGGQKLVAYINSACKPTATIVFKGTLIGDKNAPMMAFFSSRGPSRASPGILKPDIIGPGVNILAAWPSSVENNINAKYAFNILSGTSMSCPHLSGVAALLKSTHPDWSPAAIKSAMMTTADIVNCNNAPIEDERFLPADIFAVGSGHVNPSKANDPGLIYDLETEDYVRYLCGLNYTNQQMCMILKWKLNCSGISSILEGELNYPSFSIVFGLSSQTYTRTLTNVGEANASYTVDIHPPYGVNVVVNPCSLQFSKLNEKLKFEVTFSTSDTTPLITNAQGHILWKSSKHSVRSPVAVVKADL